MIDGWEQRDEQLEGFLRQVKALECDLRIERGLVEKLRAELQEQGRELLEARTVAARAVVKAERAEWALLGVQVLGAARG